MSAFVTIRHAAGRLGVHENTVRNWMQRGFIAFRQLPSGVRRIPVSELDRVIAESFVIRNGLEDQKPVVPPAPAGDQPAPPAHRPMF